MGVAARGGSQGKRYTYAGSSNVDEVAWYGSNSGNTTHPVGGKQANEVGLYDMGGNVYEWCLDWCDAKYYGRSPATDPLNTQAASYRAPRGGSRHFGARYVRSAYRDWYRPEFTCSNLGFRACLAPQSEGKQEARSAWGGCGLVCARSAGARSSPGAHVPLSRSPGAGDWEPAHGRIRACGRSPSMGRRLQWTAWTPWPKR